MQTIITKFLSPTNHRGERIKAKMSYGRDTVTIGYDYALNNEQNHLAAAKALAEKAGWSGHFAGGSCGSDGWVFVNVAGAYTDRMHFTRSAAGHFIHEPTA